MEFEDQIKNLELIIDRTPRVYIKWDNTEKGRDKNDCYERIVIGSIVRYVNTNNRNIVITRGHSFFDILEKIYDKSYTETFK